VIAGIDRRYGPLQALASYYGRMPDVEAPGWSREKFGWCVVINASGEPVDRQNLHDVSSKKPRLRQYLVPAAVKRTVAISPNLFWDKTAYSLGRTAGEGKRTELEHAAFRHMHLERLADTDDEGLLALRRFIERWTPERFDSSPFIVEMLDSNIMFRLDGDAGRYLHERPAARAIVDAVTQRPNREAVLCLATGEHGQAARLHPTIKGVEGAQSSGAALVSFNLESFESYGKNQGENAPTSESAAFRYGAALNRLLTRDGPNRVKRPIGDATTVFWADASEASAAAAADTWFNSALSLEIDDEAEARAIAQDLDAVAQGRPLSSLRPEIEAGTRFHVLGLSPNAARLSVRYWLSDDLDIFAKRLADHHRDIAILPTPWNRLPAINYLLAQTTALQGKFENIPPQLAGEMMRAVLAGTAYPRAWLAAAIARLRAGEDASRGWHAAAIRGVLARRQRLERTNPDVVEEGETPMSLDRNHRNVGYQLGRLFAVYELAQRAALGRGVKSTIRDKYFGAASAAPASIFPLIITNGQNHLSKVRKDRAGWAVLIERELEEVMGRITPSMPFSLPRSLRLEDQGEFAIGYYHQRKATLGGDAADQPTFDDSTDEGTDNDD